jgi:hypothetical protein
MKKKLLGIFLLSLPIPIVFGLVGLTDQLPFITGFFINPKHKTMQIPDIDCESPYDYNLNIK